MVSSNPSLLDLVLVIVGCIDHFYISSSISLELPPIKLLFDLFLVNARGKLKLLLDFVN